MYSFVTAQVSPLQFGFLQRRSTLHQLLLFLNKIISSLDDNAQVDAIYLDFRKAFNSVPHNELLAKLRSFGITGKLWNWFQSYLSGRLHYVAINWSCSETLPVLSGVPQGSILKPLLFIIYINDLPECAAVASMFLFADDTKCAHAVTDIADCHYLQRDLNALSDWSLQWNLLFNQAKCVHVTFTKPKCNSIETAYHLNSQTIVQKSTHKDLGVTFSANLSWTDHHNLVLAKAYWILGLLRRSFSVSNSIATKKALYISLVRSIISYCSPVWRPQLKKDIIPLEKLQRRASKFILNDFTSNYRERLLSLRLLPLMMLFELNDIMFFIRCLKQPSSCLDIGSFVKFSSSVGLRSATHNKIIHTKSKNNHSRHFYFNRLPRLWNSLPPMDLASAYLLTLSNSKSKRSCGLTLNRIMT